MANITEIKEEISKAIKQSGMSQTELASRLGVKQPNISCYISGKKLPALDTLSSLCEILDLDANEILCINK